MATLSRRNQNRTDIWPGFVDALATLLMVIIFLLMIFVIAQFFLSEALTGRDQALDRLKGQISELAELLSLERQENKTLRADYSALSKSLATSVRRSDDQELKIQALSLQAKNASNLILNLKNEISTSLAINKKNKDIIEKKIREIGLLNNDIIKLQALREELEEKVKKSLTVLASKNEEIITEKRISNSARAEVALLNKQLRTLQTQIAEISKMLDASEAEAKKQKIKIVTLGKRLNAALANKVHELSLYRSEFFGNLRKVLGNQPGVRIVGDRFVFQSEVLFRTGSAELGLKGKRQIKQLAGSLKEITKKIPTKLKWVLRVDGHTDRIPIKTSRFPSNWELSTARAISVVKFLISNNISATNLAATGFGEFQPIDNRKDEIANRRNRRIELKLTQR